MKATFCRRIRAYTLTEVMIATAVTSLLFGGLLSSSVVLLRSFSAANEYSAAQRRQVRALDYITRDLCGATIVAVSADKKKLTVTLPDYYSSYDSHGNPAGPPLTPTFDGAVVKYGDPAKPIRVAYYVEGKSLIREITVVKTNTTSRTVIGTSVNAFDMTFAQLDSVVTVSITFATSFKRGTTATEEGTKISAAVSIRNPQGV